MKSFAMAAACAAALALPSVADAAIVTVYNPVQLTAAVKAAKAGDTIRLAPGNYGDYEFRNVNPAGAITIAAAGATMPIFTSLLVDNSSNLRFTRLTVASREPAAGEVLFAATVMRSRNIRMNGMAIHGELGGGVANEPRGLRISRSTGITVAGNSFTELKHALTTDNSSYMTIADNAFTGIRVDGIITDGASNSIITRNRFSDFRPEAGDHVDAIQLFNNGNPTVNLTVSDNLMIGGNAGQMQGVFMTNAVGDRAQLDDVRITKNLMWGTMWNGIAVYDADQVSISGNKLFSNGLLDASKTWVRLQDVSNGIVSMNYAGAYIYDGVGQLAASGNVLSLLNTVALAAVARWDATHAAAGLAWPYSDAGQVSGVSSRSLQLQSLAVRPEFAASALAAVPEPASWAMLIGGFGLVGSMRRRLQAKRRRRMARA